MIMNTRMNQSKHFSSLWLFRYSVNLWASRSRTSSDFPIDDADVVLDFNTGQKKYSGSKSFSLGFKKFFDKIIDQFLGTDNFLFSFVTVARSRKIGFDFKIIVFLFNCSSFLFHFCWFLVEVFLVFLLSRITLLY